MRCSNYECGKVKPTGAFGKFLHGEGVVRENKWYCEEDCYKATIMRDFIIRKHNQSELRSSTYPVTSRAFGAVLLRMGKITWHQLELALEEKSRNGCKPLAHYLLKEKLICRKDILEALGRHHRVPVAMVGERELDLSLINMIPKEVAKLSGVIPLNYNKQTNKFSLLMKDPSDLTTLITVRKFVKCDVQSFQGDPAEIDRLVNRYYSDDHIYADALQGNMRDNLVYAN